jgi:deoxyribonuclease IV
MQSRPPPRPRLGAHMSIAGGLYRALERGAACGCEIIQVFTKSNQQWAARPISESERLAWHAARERTGIVPMLAHDCYLINLASPVALLRDRSRAALAEGYARCRLLQIPYLVLHPGAHQDGSESAGIRRVAAALERILEEQADNPTVLLLENTAGQGTSLGHRFEHLRDIMAGTGSPERLGVCFDTCHAWAAGYDIGDAAGWQRTLEELERVLGGRLLRAFHLNDAKGPRGSRLDRHEHIGRGTLGLRAFLPLLNDPRFADVPMALETPKAHDSPDGHEEDRQNLMVLRALAGRQRISSRARHLMVAPCAG